MHLSYLVIPAVTVLVAFLGGRLTARSVYTWYRKIRKPRWTPPGFVIGAVWTVLYALAALSALIMWNLPDGAPVPFGVAALFVANAVLNVAWSWTFFSQHRIEAAIWVCLLLDLTIVLLIWLITPLSALAALLLAPYAAWVTFAAYLNHRVWVMNR